MDETNSTPTWITSGWGKPMAARVWHYFVPDGNTIVSLCEKWGYEIYPSGKPAIMLWGSYPDTGAIYGTCKTCTARRT